MATQCGMRDEIIEHEGWGGGKTERQGVKKDNLQWGMAVQIEWKVLNSLHHILYVCAKCYVKFFSVK